MKISFSFQWVFAIAVVMLSACSTPKNVTDNGINKTLSNYINQISEEKLKEQLGVIASDQMQGRDTGSEGIRKVKPIHR